MSPRVLEESVHPRLQSGASGRPLNFTVRRHAMQRVLTSTILVLMLLGCWAPSGAIAAPQPKVENCGWLVPRGDGLIAQPDASLKPSDPAPLSAPPPEAKAAYCERDSIMTYVGDERVLKLGLPLVIRSGAREGVLEADPTVLFNYHRVGDQYLPGKVEK